MKRPGNKEISLKNEHGSISQVKAVDTGSCKTSFRKDTGRLERLKLTSLKACNKNIPTMIVKKPLRVPMTSSTGISCHSLKRIAEQVITDVVKNT